MPKISITLDIEENPLNEAKQILSRCGLSYSEAVNIFTHLIVENNGLPFSVQPQDNFNGQKDLRAVLTGFSDDFMSDGREQPIQQKCDNHQLRVK